MIPYLLVCQLGIDLLVLITAICGVSELLRTFIVGLGIIIGGAALVGKRHCNRLTSVHTVN